MSKLLYKKKIPSEDLPEEVIESTAVLVGAADLVGIFLPPIRDSRRLWWIIFAHQNFCKKNAREREIEWKGNQGEKERKSLNNTLRS